MERIEDMTVIEIIEKLKEQEEKILQLKKEIYDLELAIEEHESRLEFLEYLVRKDIVFNNAYKNQEQRDIAVRQELEENDEYVDLVGDLGQLDMELQEKKFQLESEYITLRYYERVFEIVKRG